MMDSNRKTICVIYIVSLLLLTVATVLSAIEGKKPQIIILSLIIVVGTLGFIRLMKGKRS